MTPESSAPPASFPPRFPVLTATLAFLWGLADATFFFFVPDVMLTRLALHDFRRAFFTSLFALAGSLLGATLLWTAASQGHTQVLLNKFTWIPGISRELIVRTAQSLHNQGLPALFTAPFLAQPLKLTAIHAGAQNVALAPFLAIAALGLLARYTLTSAFAHLAARTLRGRSQELIFRLHIWIWIGLYTVFFALKR